MRWGASSFHSGKVKPWPPPGMGTNSQALPVVRSFSSSVTAYLNGTMVSASPWKSNVGGIFASR